MVMRRIAMVAVVSSLVLALGTAIASGPNSAAAAKAGELAAKAAKDTEEGKAIEGDTFFEDESRRAAEILAKARADKEEAAFYEQVEAVEASSGEQAAWAREQLSRAVGIADSALDAFAGDTGVDVEDGPKGGPRPEIVIYVSMSMGEDTLRQVFDMGRGKADVGYAFRGVPPGKPLPEFFAYLQTFQGTEEAASINVMIDPPGFRDNGVRSVPTMVQLDEDGNAIAQVRGLVNPEWLREKVEEGATGDLGSEGPSFPIIENDLLEAMKAEALSEESRAALAKQAKAAPDRFIQSMPLISLPRATESRIRTVMPALHVERDIVDHQGVVRHKAGEVIDMSEHLPSAPILVVFDSQDPAHVDFAKRIAAGAPPGKKVIYMTTNVNRDGGFALYARQEYAIGRPVYLLMPDVRDTFGIERIPTVVTPTDKEFVIVEVPLTKGVEDAGSDAR